MANRLRLEDRPLVLVDAARRRRGEAGRFRPASSIAPPPATPDLVDTDQPQKPGPTQANYALVAVLLVAGAALLGAATIGVSGMPFQFTGASAMAGWALTLALAVAAGFALRAALANRTRGF